LPIGALRHVENDDMGMELRGGVSIDRAGGLMLELGSKHLPRCDGRVVAAWSGLNVVLKARECYIYSLLVCLNYSLVAAN